MSHHWPEYRLGDVCKIASDFVDPKAAAHSDLPHVGGANMQSATDVLIDVKSASQEKLVSGKFAFDQGVVLYSKIRPYLRKVARPEFSGLCSADIYPLTPREGMIIRDYLYYLLISDNFTAYAELGSARSGMPKVNREHLFDFRFRLPPLAEQQRIVAILDEAFSGINSAIAVVETQLEQDRELRLAALADLLPTSGSVVTLAEHVEMLVGFAFKSSDYVNDPNSIRLLRGDNVMPGAIRWADAKALSKDHASEFDRYQLAVDDIVVAMDRPWIKAGLKQARLTERDVPSLLVQRVARLRCRPALQVSYLHHLISSSLFERHVLDHAGGSGVPHISGGQLGAFSFTLPTLDDQAAIAERLDELQISYSALVRIRLQKLAALGELKQSLLARAFSGELTAANDNAFATPAQAANVMALMHWHHERARRDKTYGHVKAQKGLHLLEWTRGANLGRNPIKDAAGPNDFAHMKAAEAWAKEQGFFEFVQRGGGYDFRKLPNHSKLLVAAKDALRPIESAIKRVSDLIVPLDTDGAEALATVHAAWNNLLVDSREATPEAIIREAREDWGPSKAKFSDGDLLRAIKLIKGNGIIPDGSAKAVLHKQVSLF